MYPLTSRWNRFWGLDRSSLCIASRGSWGIPSWTWFRSDFRTRSERESRPGHPDECCKTSETDARHSNMTLLHNTVHLHEKREFFCQLFQPDGNVGQVFEADFPLHNFDHLTFLWPLLNLSHCKARTHFNKSKRNRHHDSARHAPALCRPNKCFCLSAADHVSQTKNEYKNN